MNKVLMFVVAMTFAATSAFAQVPPDAGSVRQEIERKREPVQPKVSEPTAPTSDTSVATDVRAGPSVTVSSFRFTGNTLLSETQLRSSVAAYVNKPITFAELQKAAVAVADAYRKAGWIVRAYLPMQEIAGGVVTIAVVEGLFGQVRSEGSEPKRISFDRMSSMVDAQQKQGAPLNAAGLDRALLLINDLPGVTAAGHLAAGNEERQTDLLLKVQDDPLLSGEVSLDNAGSRFTGEERLIGTVAANNPFHVGDQVGLTLLHTKGINYGQLTATAPIGYRGLRVGGHASHLKYDLVADEFAALDAHGTSTAYGLDATYPLLRARTKNIGLSFSFDSANFDNQSNDVTTSRYKVTAIDAGINGYRFDNFAGGGITSASLSLVSGKVDLSDSPNQLADAATTQVDGGFSKLRYFASRQQHVSETVSVYAAVTGQLASGNLDSSEKFYLGGAAGVRAYPTNEGGGDQGLIATVEGRVRLPHNLSVTGFYDRGQITVNRDNNFPGAATLNSYSLQGIGLAVGWTSAFHLNVKATWAYRIGDNPRAQADGSDQDGTLKKSRLWLQASMPF